MTESDFWYDIIIFKMVVITSFEAENWCQMGNVHTASPRHLCSSLCHFHRRVQQGRYCEISATIRYDTLRFFIWRISTFKPTSKLWWACPHVYYWSKFCRKMAESKINSNLKKWLFQICWVIINAIWLFSVLRRYQCKQNSKWRRTL